MIRKFSAPMLIGLVASIWLLVLPQRPAFSQEPAVAKIPREYSGSTKILNVAAQEIRTGEIGWTSFRGSGDARGVAKTELGSLSEFDVIWQHSQKPKGEFQATPCLCEIDGKPSVVIGDMDGWIVALDLMDGRTLWTYKIKFGYSCSVAFHANRFYVGNIDGEFLCLNTDGTLCWQYSGAMEIDSSPTFFEKWVLFTSQNGMLYALDAESGNEAWTLEAGEQLRCAPTVVEGRVMLAGCDASLQGIRLRDHTKEFELPLGSPTGCTAAHQGDFVFFGTQQRGMFAIDWKRNQIAWQFDDQQNASQIEGNVAVTEKGLFFGANNRTLYALDPADGSVLWRRDLKGNLQSSPVVCGEQVWLAGGDGRVTAFQIDSGEPVWEREFQGQFKSSPAIGFSRVVVASDDGVLYCLGSAKK